MAFLLLTSNLSFSLSREWIKNKKMCIYLEVSKRNSSSLKMEKVHFGAFPPWCSPSSNLPVRNQMVWRWLPYPHRERKKGTFLAWKRSRLEVNYEQRQILLSFSWVRKIKATLIPGLSPQPSNSWECYQLICPCFVVSPSLSLQIKDTTSTHLQEKSLEPSPCAHHVKNVASFPCSSQEASSLHSLHHSSSCSGSSSAASSSQALAGDKKWNSLQLSRNKCK